MDYWVDAEGNNAIWHSTGTENHGVRWRIGPHEKLGLVGLGDDPAVGIYSEKKDQKECPNNEGFVWIWYYNQGGTTFIATNDVYIECANENVFCTYDNPCGTNQGDCDLHEECQDGLFCGSKNCPDSLGFHSEFDCCYYPNVGDEHFCASGIPCGEGEGDCDAHDECQDGLSCGSNNCPDSLGFDSEVDCCYPPDGCKYQLSLFIL